PDNPSERSIAAVASRPPLSHWPSLTRAVGWTCRRIKNRSCVLERARALWGLWSREAPSFKSLSPSEESPSVPVTYRRSSTLAPFRTTPRSGRTVSMHAHPKNPPPFGGGGPPADEADSVGPAGRHQAAIELVDLRAGAPSGNG